MYPVEIPSPIMPESASAKLVDTLRTDRIAQLYRELYGYDASEDFEGLSEIAVYECEGTGYRFYYPFHLEGKEKLYRAIEDLEWTYQEGKWEHDTVVEHIPEGSSVLDVGCGRGAFLAKVKAKRSDKVTGIELNKSAAAYARERGIDVVEALIGEHAKERPAFYDVITSFQVLEHIANPIPFLRDCVAALKPGGLLVLAVPNNDGFLRFDPDAILNQPPHHVGLWNARSLAAIASLLPVSLETIEEEPLREVDWYRQVMERRYLPRRWQRSLYYRVGAHKIFARFIEENRQTISGHTIIAYYRRQSS